MLLQLECRNNWSALSAVARVSGWSEESVASRIALEEHSARLILELEPVCYTRLSTCDIHSELETSVSILRKDERTSGVRIFEMLLELVNRPSASCESLVNSVDLRDRATA